MTASETQGRTLAAVFLVSAASALAELLFLQTEPFGQLRVVLHAHDAAGNVFPEHGTELEPL